MRNQWRLAVGVFLLVAIVAAGLYASSNLSQREASIDLSRSKPSKKGVFVVSIRPEDGEPTVGPLHSWILSLTTADGVPLKGATMTVAGGMPQHSHGLPTQPRVAPSTDGGQYRIEGVKFSMTGLWELRLAIEAGGKSDEVVFNVKL